MSNSLAPRLLVGAAAFVLAWPIAGYPATLAALAKLRRRKPAPSAHAELPTMTVILPTYQERRNIEQRLRNLAESDYPRELLDVVVVDSGSTDGTGEAVTALAPLLGGLRVHLVQQASREGKAAAINLGISEARGALIVITDAPTLFAPDALTIVASRFGDRSVGAATGRFEVTGEGGAVRRAESRFWRVRNRLRSLEADVDSTPFLSGELACFRRELIDRLDEDTLADDMNIALQVRRGGYRVVTCDDARLSEPRSNAIAELMETKSRRAAGGVQELLRFRDMMFDRRLGLFGTLILPSAMLYYIPLRAPAAIVLLAAACRRFRRLPRGAQLAGFIATLAGLRALPRERWEQAGMLLFNEWIFVLGWWRIVRRRMDVRWAQERSTRGEVRSAEDAGVA